MTKKEFDSYLERTVLGQLSSFMDKCMTEDWEPRALRMLGRISGRVIPLEPLTLTTEWGVAGDPGTAQDSVPATPVWPGEVGAKWEASTAEATPRAGKRKRGKVDAPTPSPEEKERKRSPSRPEVPWSQVLGCGALRQARKHTTGQRPQEQQQNSSSSSKSDRSSSNNSRKERRPGEKDISET